MEVSDRIFSWISRKPSKTSGVVEGCRVQHARAVETCRENKLNIPGSKAQATLAMCLSKLNVKG